ncbi:MAG: hypothetical protein IT314_02800 [Anaerolineales bacterium]|nr:hypothetical protein [Anaerolineales bacterium]
MNAPLKPESALKREWRLFKDGSARLVNAYLNMMFDLSPKASRGRFWAFALLFVSTGFLLSLINYPLTLWLERVQDIFLYFFNPAYRAGYTAGDPISNLLLFALQVFLDPKNLRFIPLLLAPYFISVQLAAIYLADIFNPEKVPVSTARKHILEVALGGSDETIRIAQGEIAAESEKSPNILIGGPGKVVVELDSVALFEKPDGTPRVIGPTQKEPGGKATIEGFERFREALYLRDHFVELRDLEKETPSVAGRSKDGIPISATDVRFLFSIDREGKTSSLEIPYPFRKQAVEDIIYKHTSKVALDKGTPSIYDFRWIDNMVNLIRGELGKFMNQYKLTEYLASFGIPEVDNAHKREDKYLDEARNVLPVGEELPERLRIPPVPEFVPRPDITNLFYKFAEKFNQTARERGVQLQWIGVGTWKSPVEKVLAKHIDAWKVGKENAAIGNAEALEKFKVETSLTRLMEIIQEIPLGSYAQAASKTSDEKFIMQATLGDFRKQLIQARDLWLKKGFSAPVEVEDAIKTIERVLWHPVGRTAPTGSADSQNESDAEGSGDSPSAARDFAYEDLVARLSGDRAAADRLIEYERSQFPNESEEKLIGRAIDRLIQDRR